MKHYEITYKKEFTCLAGECPATCCKGWQVLVDQSTYETVCADTTPLGKKTKKNIMAKKQEGQTYYYMKQGFQGCGCLTREGLCALEAAGRKDLMSWICQEYPRRILDFGPFCETTLELACFKVASIFVAERELPTMVESTEVPEHMMWKMENEDKRFLSILEKMRKHIICQIADAKRFDATLQNNLYDYIKMQHDLLVRNKMDEVEKNLHVLQLEEKNGENNTNALQQDPGDEENDLFYSMEIVDKVIAYNIDDVSLWQKSLPLKKLCRQYFHYFNGLTPGQAKEFYHQTRKKMEEDLPNLQEKYRNYYVNYLYQMFFTSYEDYHLLKVILLGNMYLQIYMLFDMVAWLEAKKKKESYSQEKQAEVLSALERRMRHNLAISDGIMGRLRKDFLT